MFIFGISTLHKTNSQGHMKNGVSRDPVSFLEPKRPRLIEERIQFDSYFFRRVETTN